MSNNFTKMLSFEARDDYMGTLEDNPNISINVLPENRCYIYVDASRMEDQSGFGIFIHDSITLKAIFIQAKSFLIPLVFKLNLQVSI